MNSRDLYAACSGIFGVVAVQQVGSYLAEPKLGVAVALVVLAFLFVASMAAHVTVIVTERDGERAQRSKTAPRRTRKQPRRPLASVARAKATADKAA